MEHPEVKAGTWCFRQLFINGERRPRTRLPKQENTALSLCRVIQATSSGVRLGNSSMLRATSIAHLAHLQDVEVVEDHTVVGQPAANRKRRRSDADSHFHDRPSLFALVSGNQPGVYWVENVFEALDTPGQWYLGGSRGVLYYLPRPGRTCFR